MKKTAAFLLLAFLLCACERHAPAIPSGAAAAKPQEADREGRQYRQELTELIRKSDRIVVTEHSYEYDAYDMDAGKSLIDDEIVYGTRELDAAQKAFFLSTIEALDPKTQDAIAACIFEPHHTIEFYAAGKLASTMDICFQCGQVEWDKTRASPPWALYSGLAAVVEHIGFSPDRDWATLAKRHLK